MPPVWRFFIFSIKDITKMGLMLATMIVAKFLNSIIPDLPNGLGDLMPLLPIVVVTWSLFIDFKLIIFVILIYMGFTWISPHIFISGIEWVKSPLNIFGVFMLDYFIPISILSIISIGNKNKYVLILASVFMNYISHISSGVIFWRDYAWSGWEVWAYSITANSIQFSVLLFTSILIAKMFSKNISGMIIQDGYVNDSYKVKINGEWMQKRVPKHSVADWNNEKKVYSKLDIKIEFNDDGSFLKEWIPGKVIKKWSKKQLDSLVEQIQIFHKKDKSEILKHDWFVVRDYKKFIPDNIWKEYIELIASFENHKTVLSHNDINSHNVIWDGQQIHLIDFEWSRVNSIYYDYAQFMVAESIYILPPGLHKKEFLNMVRAIMIFNLLWTYSMPDTKKLLRLRTKYKKMLGI